MSGFSLVVNPVPGPSRLNEGWKLPFDVMSGIMAVSLRSTISALMKTCRTLHTEGLKHLLRDGVQLSWTSDVINFVTFMLNENPPRFAYLRKLGLLVPRLSYPDVGVHLVQLLSHPSLALETLVLRPAQPFLGSISHPTVREAVSRLTTVKHLVAVGVEETTAGSIRRLPWALESIAIGVEPNIRDILPIVAPFSDTLRTLLIKEESFGVYPGPWYLIQAVGSIFPAMFFGAHSQPHRFPLVQTFGIVYRECVTDLLASAAFADAFPAITHLQLIPPDPPTTDLSRVWQLILLPLVPIPRQSRPLSWPSLNECSGDLRSLEALHFDCALSTLRLWRDIRAAELDPPRRAGGCTPLALQEPPERIDVRVVVTEFASILQLRALPEALLRRVPTGLCELNVLFHAESRLYTHTRPYHNLAINDVLETCTRLTSAGSGSTAPSLKVSCRLLAEGEVGDWQWPDLGQRVIRNPGVDRAAEHNLEGFP